MNGEEEVVQDNRRERQIAVYCGLVPTTGRAGVDANDASGNPFELKSATKSGVTTARDVGLHTVAEWRKKYWIIAVGRNLKTGFQVAELFLAHPNDLEERFAQIEERLGKDLEAGEAVLAAARKFGVADECIRKATYLINRGATLNNPKIPLALIRASAKPLATDNSGRARRQIRDFVRAHPLKR